MGLLRFSGGITTLAPPMGYEPLRMLAKLSLMLLFQILAHSFSA